MYVNHSRTQMGSDAFAAELPEADASKDTCYNMYIHLQMKIHYA